MGKQLINELSWSVSRWQQYQSCQRAYYYTYYGAWGGWNADAPERTRLIYRLKNMKTMLMWAGSIVHGLLKDALDQYARIQVFPTAEELQERGRLLLRQGWRECVKKEWIQFPKKNCLIELYYGDGKSLPREQTDFIRDRVFNCLEAFASSPFVRAALQVPYTQWKSVDVLDSFLLNGYKIWGAIDFAYTDNEGILHIADWKTGGENPASLRLQLACYALMAMDKWKVPLEKLALHGVFLNDGGRKSDYSVDAELLISVKEQILQSIETLRRKLSDPEHNLAEEENFDFTGCPQQCASCNYREICPCVAGSN